MTIRTTEVQKAFNVNGVQLNPDAKRMINNHIEREIKKMVVRCINGNVKRLTPELMWVALGRTSDTH